MTLFGLDLAHDRNGNYVLFEINGINSGMPGFEQLYGDKRIENQVYSLLRERYGDIAVHDGTHTPHKHWWQIGGRNFSEKRQFRKATYLQKEKAHIAWWKGMENVTRKKINFPLYRGQKCAVFNTINEELPHRLINPFVVEDITHNKLLQYLLLKKTELGKYVVPSALVGLGATRGQELERVLQEDVRQFVLKPLRGCQSIGVQIIYREEAERFKNEEGPLWEMSLQEEYRRSGQKPCYIEDLISKNDFFFEWGVSLLQPFVDTRKQTNKQEYYTAIRAIVCNEQFIGAYIKYSSDPRVHFSHRNEIGLWEDGSFSTLCEKIVGVFLHESLKLDPKTFRRELYQQFVQERGKVKRTEFPQRSMAAIVKLLRGI